MDHMDKLNSVYKFILENVKTKAIDLQAGTHIIKLLQQLSVPERQPVAIVGMSGKFPHASSPNELWEMVIRNGVNAVRSFPSARQRDICPLLFEDESEAAAAFGLGAYLAEIDRFDPSFFQLSMREAKLMDPHQKLLLQTVWETIEDAGHAADELAGSNTGVYVGYSTDFGLEYKRAIESAAPEMEELSLAGNIKSMIAGRIAYYLDLKGPAVMIDTACSSSLVAVHAACKAIMNGDCEQAIAGSVKLCLAPLKTSYESGVSIVSPTYTAKTFDDSANGTGLGEGAAAILLKRLDRAIADGNQIYAVIKGGAVNQDGSSIGITAPNPIAQEEVIIQAWKDAKIEPETISYMEAHGTGTALGDPIEIEGINSAFRRYTGKKQFCAIGSIKTNIGHLDAAAGIAGVIKVALALKHRQIPPSLHFQRPNRKIDFEQSPVYVSDKLYHWENEKETPRRAGISSFGLSGTNCHLVLEEAPVRTTANLPNPDMALQPQTQTQAQVLALSAKSEEGLQQLAAAYIKRLKRLNDAFLPQVCYTANTGRKHFNFRLAVVCRDTDSLIEALQQINLCKADWPGLYYQGQSESEPQTDGEEAIMTTLVKQAISSANAAELTGDLAARERELHALARLYVQGANINWKHLFANERWTKISLPSYPFAREKTWLDIQQTAASAKQRNSPTVDMFYGMEWKQQNINGTVKVAAANTETEASTQSLEGLTLLVYNQTSPLLKQVRAQMQQLNKAEIVEVKLAKTYAKRGSGKFSVGSSPDDFERVMLACSEGNVSNVIYVDGRADGTGITEPSSRFISLTHCLKALVWNSEQMKNSVHVAFLTSSPTKEKGKIALLPAHASLIGLAKVARQEYPHLNCSFVDTDSNTDIKLIMDEIVRRSDACPVVYRNNTRYVEELNILDITRAPSRDFLLKKDGVYLITGGTGALGLEIAAYLASKQQVKLALVNRSPLPPEENWESVLSEGSDPKLCRKLEALRGIAEIGAEVRLFQADVANKDELEAVLHDVRNGLGPLDGVFHCAGVAGKNYIFHKEEEQLRQVLRPKVEGTIWLDQLTANDDLQFMVLFSSVTSLFAGEGQADYAGANRFLDAYPFWDANARKHIITINWPAWKEVGMAVDHHVQDTHFFKSISTGRAINALDAVLNHHIQHVLIGERNERVAIETDSGFFDVSPNIMALFGGLSKRKLDDISQGQHEADTSDLMIECNFDWRTPGVVQEKIAAVWANVLDAEEVDIHDSFNDLGGDSIMAGIIIQRINRLFPDALSIVDVYTYPTIASMAERVIERLASRSVQPAQSDSDAPIDNHTGTVSSHSETANKELIFKDLKQGHLSLEKTLELFRKEWRNDD